jgi:hypothetical protein
MGIKQDNVDALISRKQKCQPYGLSKTYYLPIHIDWIGEYFPLQSFPIHIWNGGGYFVSKRFLMLLDT